MLITEIAWYGVRVPFRSPFSQAQGRAIERHGLMLVLHTDTEAVGLGEASPVGLQSDEGTCDLVRTLHQIAPLIIGHTPAEILGISKSSKPVAHVQSDAGPIFSKLFDDSPSEAALAFGLETAAYDLMGKECGKPVTVLFGGCPRAVPVNALIGADSPTEVASKALTAVAEGFSTLKLKLGSAIPGLDEATVRQVRKVVGAGVRLRIDANEAWDFETAVKTLTRLEPYDLEYVEQPLVASDVAGLARLRRLVKVPIAADEALSGPATARILLDADAADVFVVKLASAGGLHRGREIMTLAESYGKVAVITSSIEFGVGTSAALHLAATSGDSNFASGLATTGMLEHDLLLNSLTPISGNLTVPSTPGLGVELDMRTLLKYSMLGNGSIVN